MMTLLSITKVFVYQVALALDKEGLYASKIQGRKELPRRAQPRILDSRSSLELQAR